MESKRMRSSRSKIHQRNISNESLRGNMKTGVMALASQSMDWLNEQHKQDWLRLTASAALMNLTRCCGASCASRSQAAPGLLPRRVPADHRYPAVPTATWEQGRQRLKPHKPSRAEQTGFTELLSSQAPIPRTTLVAHSLSQGLWAGKYGFMFAHITFGSREAFKSNYGECYLHELLF